MSSAIQIDVGPEKRSRSYGDQACVDDDAVGVDIDSLAHFHVESIVNSDGGVDPWLTSKERIILIRVLLGRRKRGFVIDYTASSLELIPVG